MSTQRNRKRAAEKKERRRQRLALLAFDPHCQTCGCRVSNGGEGEREIACMLIDVYDQKRLYCPKCQLEAMRADNKIRFGKLPLDPAKVSLKADRLFLVVDEQGQTRAQYPSEPEARQYGECFQRHTDVPVRTVEARVEIVEVSAEVGAV